MTKVNLCRGAAFVALFSVGGCASYQAPSVATPVAPASSAGAPPPGNDAGVAAPENTLEPRVGVHKPSDDTRINSGAGNADPMDDGSRRD